MPFGAGGVGGVGGVVGVGSGPGVCVRISTMHHQHDVTPAVLSHGTILQ